jgi:hypothetical protein
MSLECNLLTKQKNKTVARCNVLSLVYTKQNEMKNGGHFKCIICALYFLLCSGLAARW